jgi:hypothetical protein
MELKSIVLIQNSINSLYKSDFTSDFTYKASYKAHNTPSLRLSFFAWVKYFTVKINITGGLDDNEAATSKTIGVCSKYYLKKILKNILEC